MVYWRYENAKVCGFAIITGRWLGAAERRQLYRFCADLGGLALKIAYDHGGVTEKS
jgi:hypothetical protein